MSQATTNQNVVDGLGTQPANAGGWPNDTVLLVLAYSKTEKYFPVIRQNLDQFWPGRPRTLYVTDGDATGDDVIRAKDVSFLELLSEALSAVRDRYPSAENVFLLLEDLCPLGPVDEAKLACAQDLLRSQGKKFLCHVWERKTDGTTYYQYLDGPDSLRNDEISLFQISGSFTHPNSLVAVFWEMDHLEDVIAAKLELDCHDPWAFEVALEDQNEDHFMFSGVWPVYKDGFLIRGKLNLRAISRRECPDSPLLSQLRIEYCGVDSYHATALKRAWHKLGNSIRKRVGLLSDTSPNPMATDRRR